MITEWAEIEKRYDAIKDHKPKASKKLKELGEILASAYTLDPQKADEMWQYIIDLNVNDDINNAKFYVAQVYKKILDQLPPPKAAEFINMRLERVRLLFAYGYNGETVIYVAYTIIGNYVVNGEVEQALDVLSILENKFEDEYSYYIVLDSICVYLEEKPSQFPYAFRYDISAKTIVYFYKDYYKSTDNDYIHAILYSRVCLITQIPVSDMNSALSILKLISEIYTHSFAAQYNTFTSLLYLEREVVGEKAEGLLYDYLNEKHDCWLPVLYRGFLEEPAEDVSAWIAGIIMKSPRLLKLVFQRWICSDFPKHQLHEYMRVSDWNSFLQYLVLGLNQSDAHNADTYLDFVNYEIDDYLADKYQGTCYEDGKWWRIGRVGLSEIETPRINQKNVSGFIEALAKACLLTSGSTTNERLTETVRRFATKEAGNTDALKNLGLDLQPDKRTAIQAFLDFVNSNDTVEYTSSFSRMQHSQRIDQFVKDIERETNKNGEELGRELAKYSQIVEYLFLRSDHSFIIKEEIIKAALLDGNSSVVMKCVDSMIETTHYINESFNPWLMEIHNILSTLLRDLLFKTKYEKPFPETVTSSTIQIVKKCLPYLPDDDALLLEIMLLKYQPDTCDINSVIGQVMSEVEAYTAKQKPKGYSSRINDITRNIQEAQELFFQIDRVDVIAQMLRKISDGRSNIAGPSYEAWMTVFHEATNEQLNALYFLLSDVYTTYIDVSNQHMALSLLNTFGKTGNAELFNRIKEQVIQKHGYDILMEYQKQEKQ